MRALYREQIYKHGDCATVSVYPVFASRRVRRGRYKPTNEVQQILNDENRKDRLTRQLDCYFHAGEGYWTLTFSDERLPQTRRDCLRAWSNFRRRLIRRFSGEGQGELRMAAVIHGDAGGTDEGGRFHVHAVIGAEIPASEMALIWGQGFVYVSPLKPGKRGLRGLARYMIKGMRWGRVMTTRNLVDPTPTERTGRLSRADAQAIHDNWDDKTAYKELLPGYEVVDVEPFYNWFNHYYYLRVFLHRIEA